MDLCELLRLSSKEYFGLFKHFCTLKSHQFTKEICFPNDNYRLFKCEYCKTHELINYKTNRAIRKECNNDKDICEMYNALNKKTA